MAAAGKEVKALENRPVLQPGLDVYIAAFTDLYADRQFGMAVGPIPWSSIIKWCHVHGIYDINDIDVFIRHIRALEKVDSDIADKKTGE